MEGAGGGSRRGCWGSAVEQAAGCSHRGSGQRGSCFNRWKKFSGNGAGLEGTAVMRKTLRCRESLGRERDFHSVEYNITVDTGSDEFQQGDFTQIPVSQLKRAEQLMRHSTETGRGKAGDFRRIADSAYSGGEAEGDWAVPGSFADIGFTLHGAWWFGSQGSEESLAGWQLNHFPGQPVPMLDNPFSEVKFPNIQSKPPLAQLEAISSRPITCYLGEETDPHLSTASFQAVVESDEVSPQPPLLQVEQPQVPQPLPISLVLQTLPQLRCPSLDTLQPLNVSLVVGGPKLNTAFEVRPHQCRVQGHDHCPSPAGHTIPDTSQDAIGFLGHLGTLLAHIQLAVNQHPQVFLCWAAFQPLFPKPVALHGVAVAQVQDPALSLVEPHTIGPSPWIQPVQVPLQSLPTLKQINTPAQLGVVCKLTEGALDPFVQIIDKDIKQGWPQHRALGDTACDQPPTGVNSIHHHSLGPAMQPVLNPAKSTPVQAMSSQFLQENAVGNRLKGFTEV
ncbi:hypothetical protein QYF61_017005 [Mycteria americana]|uniref:Uncharacterized protein n=1 Tax=Mycteria americana TaxID=33587 RepID=A0AAN7MSJ9_MYCAM|nr:hypothetical protein QYF61_017005 [Mycteria americana]